MSVPRIPSDSDTQSHRLLAAIEIIGKHGPVTSETLRDLLGVPKTVAWRLVKRLREAGWVRFRHGGHLIELDPRLDDLFATAHFSDREFSAVGDLMTRLAEGGKFHLDLFVPDHSGEVTLQETTRRLTVASSAFDVTDEFIDLSIMTAMSPQQTIRKEARVQAASGGAKWYPASAQPTADGVDSTPGYVWDYDRLALNVSIIGKMGTPAAMRITPKSRGPRPLVVCDAFRKLRKGLAGAVLSFGKPGETPSAKE